MSDLISVSGSKVMTDMKIKRNCHNIAIIKKKVNLLN